VSNACSSTVATPTPPPRGPVSTKGATPSKATVTKAA
jgi:hypothetical protein